MPHFTVKFTPSQGSEFEVKNVTGVRLGLGRPLGPNGAPALNGFDIDTIHIDRIRSMPDQKGKAEAEPETIRLAATLGTRAAFKGEVTIAPDNDPTNPALTMRWDTGYLCSLSINGASQEMAETLSVAVSEMQVGDETFKRINRD